MQFCLRLWIFYYGNRNEWVSNLFVSKSRFVTMSTHMKLPSAAFSSSLHSPPKPHSSIRSSCLWQPHFKCKCESSPNQTCSSSIYRRGAIKNFAPQILSRLNSQSSGDIGTFEGRRVNSKSAAVVNMTGEHRLATQLLIKSGGLNLVS